MSKARREFRRRVMRDDIATAILRYTGKPGFVVDLGTLREAERMLGLRKPPRGQPFSLEKGRQLRVVLRLIELRLISRADFAPGTQATIKRLESHITPERVRTMPRRIRPVTATWYHQKVRRAA